MVSTRGDDDFGSNLKNMQKRLSSIERHKHPASVDGDGALPPGAMDIPKAPTYVEYDTVYLAGVPAIETTWTEPTQNTDNTPLVDFWRYEIQQQIGMTAEWGAPDLLAPAKPDAALNKLFDRRGMGFGWTGGDGGASTRDSQGRDWFFWSDSNWGKIGAKGETLAWLMMRNSLTRSVGTDPNSLEIRDGRKNIMPDDPGWANSSGVSAIEGGYRWAPGTETYIYTGFRPLAEPGEAITFSARIENAPTAYVRIQFYDEAGAVVGVHNSQPIGDDKYVSVSGVGPATAHKVLFLVFRGGASGPVDLTQLYVARGDVRMASWRTDQEFYDFTNVAENPTGSGTTGGSSAPVEVWRNVAVNPSAEANNANIGAAYGGATMARVASTSAYVGEHVFRLSRNVAGNGLIYMLEYNKFTVAPGQRFTARFRVRKGQLTNSSSLLQIGMQFYASGSPTGSGGSTVQTIALSGGWVEVMVSGVAPAATTTVGVQLVATGPAWSAADQIEIDAREAYISTAAPANYFDGSTPDRDGMVFEWAGAAHGSDSIMSVSSVQRRNLALYPLTITMSGWAPVNSATARADGSDTPTGGTGVALPAIIKPGVLGDLVAKLNTPSAMVGIGVMSDSTGETTGSQSNTDLGDRYVEILQRELRRYQGTPDVLLNPVGYYGASAYVAASYAHPGPVDWETDGPTSHTGDMGAGGRALQLPVGSSAYLRATFARAVVEFPRFGFSRDAIISIDGVVQDRINLQGDSNLPLVKWDTGDLPYGEHLITIESAKQPGYGGGDIRVAGAMLYDGADRTKGTHVYDLSASGRAMQDIADTGRIIRHSIDRPLDLLIWSLDVNDAGRNRTKAQYKADITTALNNAALLGYTGKHLLMAKWTPSSTITDQWTYSMDVYRAAQREVAQSRTDTAFIDLGEVMPGPDVDPSMYDDWIHQNEIGHQRIAAILRGVILGEGDSGAILVNSAAAGRGIAYTGWAPGAFSNRKTFTASVSVKGPVGRKVRARVKVAGMADDLSAPFTLTGDWDRISVIAEVSLAATSTTPELRIEQADSSGAMQWRVSQLLVEEGQQTRDFFHGGTPDSGGVDYGWNSAGEAIAMSEGAALWSAGSPRTLVEFDSSVRRSFTGSVRARSLSVSDPAVVDMRLGLHSGVSGLHTVAGAVFPGPGVTEVNVAPRRRATSGGAVTLGPVVTVPTPRQGEWVMFRFEVAATAASTLYGIQATAVSSTGAAEFWITEVTTVAGSYSGPLFAGGSRGAHAESEWASVEGYSKSTLHMSNTSFAHDPYQHTTLLVAEAFGLEPWKFLWCQGAVGVGDVGLMFLQSFHHRPTWEETGFNFEGSHDIVVARFDLEREVLLDTYVLDPAQDDPIQWGEATWVEGDWLYVYGSEVGRPNAGGTAGTMVRRYPVADIFGTDPQRLTGGGSLFTSAGWSPMSGTPKPVALSDKGGFAAIRELGGRWVALMAGAYMEGMTWWEAPGPTGPFVPQGTVYSYPGESTDINRYVPRFHPQYDTNKDGIVMMFHESGAGKYGPFFLRGPSGVKTAVFGDAYWGKSHLTEKPEFTEAPVEPDTPYRVRVRTLDKYGNASEWELGSEAYVSDWPDVPKPSMPIASSFFRGGKVYWDGLDESGDPYEGFRYYEVHINAAGPDFEPNNWSRVDTSMAQGGVSPVSVDDYRRYYAMVIVVTDAGRSEPSDPAVFEPERLSDPDLGQTLIDGARLQPGTVNASALVVGSFTNNLLMNSNFEQPSITDPELASMWAGGWPRGDLQGGEWDSAGTWERSTVDPISGTASLLITTHADTSRQVLSDPPIPLLPGDIYYVAARFRTDGIDGDIDLNFVMGETEEDVNGFAGTGASQSVTVGTTAGGQSINIVEGPVEVPDLFGDGSGNAMHFGAVAIEAKATGRAYRVWVDEVEVKRVTGSAAIADASINRAKIRYLAVDDARIANVGVGKLVAGELWADITVSSRIMTDRSGKRVEMNENGVFGFNPALTGGDDMVPVTELRSSDGGLVSQWFRTNTTGTRIEMGKYGMGANSALIAFFDDSGKDSWQFPPAMGYGGGGRFGAIPGIGIHAGSQSEAQYQKYGMNMIGVDQQGGIHLTTGNLLSGSQSTHGAPITINAGGATSFVRIQSGGGGDPAELYLDPQSGESHLSLNRGKLNLLQSTSGWNYYLQFVESDVWLPNNHILLSGGNGGFRFAVGSKPNAIVVTQSNTSFDHGVHVHGLISGPAGTGAPYGTGGARLRTRDNTTIEFDRHGNGWENNGTQRVTDAWWVNDAGNVEGLGSWNVPRIKVRAQESYISWNAQGDAYVDGYGVKTFVIDHPVDDAKRLVHAAVEGPTADVFYRGEARLEDGRVEVALPDYFTELTVAGSATVQVTVIYEPDTPVMYGGAPALMASRVKGGRFSVVASSGHEDVAFFWEVKAERAGTGFVAEPLKADTVVAGDGPYTYLVR